MKDHGAIEILVATTNGHKLGEMRAILGPLGIEVLGLQDITEPVIATELPEPIEDADSFAGNARIKATYYAKALGRRCIADDSGLVVEALNGEPGVYSARYAGIGETRAERDRANNEKLLCKLMLFSIPQEARQAKFVCAMCLADETGEVLAETKGEFAGVITDEERGANGFGYDPLLYVPELGKTSAELTPAEKNARSHRGAAARGMAEKILMFNG